MGANGKDEPPHGSREELTVDQFDLIIILSRAVPLWLLGRAYAAIKHSTETSSI